MKNKALVYWVAVIVVLSIVKGLHSSYFPELPSYHMINVSSGRSQGDANLLINENVITMIDAGYQVEARKAVVPYLGNLGIERIDHFFISHAHRDHYEGMEAILNAGIKITNIYYSMPPDDISDCCYSKSHFLKFLRAAENKGAKLKPVSSGFRIDYPGNSEIEVLYAHMLAEFNGSKIDVNDMSLIMKWRVNGHAVLFAGDLNRKIGRYLSNDDRMKADVLKVPHHGGRSMAPDSFLNTVSPVYNMVPGPKWIWCGERGNQARNWAVKNKIPTFVNGLNGDVKMTFGKQIKAISQRVGKCGNTRFDHAQ